MKHPTPYCTLHCTLNSAPYCTLHPCTMHPQVHSHSDLVRSVEGFEDSIRKFVCHVICITYQVGQGGEIIPRIQISRG